MTTTELIKLLKKYEFGGATGRPREVMFQIDDEIVETDNIEVVGAGDGLVTELFLSLPSAERKGKWIKMSDADGIYWACSECGEDIPRVPHYNPQFDLFPRLESIEKTNFCPNCGADMRGETDE